MFLQFIIPYYGLADQLITAVNSVFNQTDIEDIGIIVIDDNHFDDEGREQSTKACLFLNQHRNDGINILYIKNKQNLGVGPTRNKGLVAATAKYIAFIDSDDEIATNYVALFRGWEKKFSYNVFVGKYSYLQGEYCCIHNHLTWLHGKIYKLSFLRYNHIFFPPLRFNEDAGFGTMVFEMTKSIYTYTGDEIIYFWKTNPNSLTKSGKGEIYSVQHYVKSNTFAVKRILKKYNLNNTQRIPATLLKIYFYYCELLFQNYDVNSISPEIQLFFDTIHHTEWYKLDSFKQKLGQSYTIGGDSTIGTIPEITLAQFVSMFEKEPLNFR